MSTAPGETSDATWAFVLRTVREEVSKLVAPGEVAERTGEILLSLVEKGREWPSTVEQLGPYLRALVKNACRHQLLRWPRGLRMHSLERMAERGQVFAAEEAEEALEPGEAAKTLPEHVPGLVLRQLRRRISPKARLILQRLFVEGQSIKAVARELGLTPSGVRYHKKRILDQARTLPSS